MKETSRRCFVAASIVGGFGLAAMGTEVLGSAFPRPPHKPGLLAQVAGRIGGSAPLPPRKPGTDYALAEARLDQVSGHMPVPPRKPETAKILALRNSHTGEDLEVAFYANGVLLRDGLKKINWLLRDHRREEARTIDPDLLHLLHGLHTQLGSQEPFTIISGYRSPATNNMLRSRSSNVAKNSYHCIGKAVDICLKDQPLSKVRGTALAMSRGGVGFYPRSNFVHVDTGPVRRWNG